MPYACRRGGRSPALSTRNQRDVAAARGHASLDGGMSMAGSGATTDAVGKPLHELTAREAARAMATGAFSAEAYVEALLDWQARWRVLNAYTQQDAAAAREAARRAAAITSPISGLPIAVKDNVDVAGYATTGGTPGLRNHMPRANAPLVQSLIDQGAVMMGKVGL